MHSQSMFDLTYTEKQDQDKTNFNASKFYKLLQNDQRSHSPFRCVTTGHLPPAVREEDELIGTEFSDTQFYIQSSDSDSMEEARSDHSDSEKNNIL